MCLILARSMTQPSTEPPTEPSTQPVNQAARFWPALAGLLVGASATAWTPAALSQPLPELLLHSLAADPAVSAAQAQLRVTEHRVYQAKAGFGPSAALSANQTETRYNEAPSFEMRPFRSKQLSVQVTQPLIRTALFPTLEGAQAQVEQAQAALEQAQTEAAQRLVEASFEVLKARDLLVFNQAQRVATAEQLLLAQRSFKAGTAAVTDVRDAEARSEAVAAQTLAAESDLDLRRQVLDEVAGTAVQGLLERSLGGDRLPVLEVGSVLEWLSIAQTSSLQLKQARQALVVAESEVRKAWQGHAPTADLTYNYTMSSDTGTVTSTFPRRGDTQAVGINVNIPLFASGATQSKVAETVALRDKAQSELDTARRTLTLGVRQAFSTTLSAVAQARGLSSAVRSQELSFRANRRGYEVGMKVNAEVLDAQSKLFEARRDLSRARYDAWAGYIKLKALAGQLVAADLSALDGLLVVTEAATMRVPMRPPVGAGQ